MRLIDADALKLSPGEHGYKVAVGKEFQNGVRCGLQIASAIIMDADPVIRSGLWEHYTGDAIIPHYRCSNCGFSIEERYVERFSYCPHCGFEMEVLRYDKKRNP